jgi:acyl carrier protein
MVPSLLMVLEKMPLTPNGKIDRRALPVPGESRPAAAGEFVAPATETEGKLARIWQHLLGVEKIGRKDNFFNLGGHSLKEIQLVNRIRDNFNVEIPLRTSYQLSTIAELAEHIDKERQQAQKTPPSQPPNDNLE